MTHEEMHKLIKKMYGEGARYELPDILVPDSVIKVEPPGLFRRIFNLFKRGDLK